MRYASTLYCLDLLTPYYVQACFNRPDNSSLRVRARRRLFRVRKRILPVNVQHVHAVLPVKTLLARGLRGFRGGGGYLGDDGLLRTPSVFELRRAEDHLHPSLGTSMGPPPGLQKRHRRLADSNPGKQYHRVFTLERRIVLHGFVLTRELMRSTLGVGV